MFVVAKTTTIKLHGNVSVTYGYYYPMQQLRSVQALNTIK